MIGPSNEYFSAVFQLKYVNRLNVTKTTLENVVGEHEPLQVSALPGLFLVRAQ